VKVAKPVKWLVGYLPLPDSRLLDAALARKVVVEFFFKLGESAA
jgi:hypothetical protein